MANNNTTVDSLNIDVKAVNNTTKTFNKVISNLQSLSKAIDKIDTNKINTLSKSISNLGNASGHTVNTMKSLGTNLMSVNSKVNILKGNVDKLVGSLNRLHKVNSNTKNPTTNTTKDDTQQPSLSNNANAEDTKNSFSNLDFSNKISSLTSKIPSIFAKVGESASSIGKTILPKLGSAAVTVGKGFVGLGKIMGKSMATTTGTLAQKVSSVTKSFSKLGSTFARVLTYKAISTLFQAINKAISQGISNLYQYSKLMSGTFSKSMDQLATSCQYFSNSVASAIAPLINVIAPVVDAIIDKLVEAINVINQFFSALTGAKTWTKASKQATKYASAVSSASDKLKGSLAGFDEINNIGNTNSSSSGSGGDYGTMFEEQDSILSDISDFASKLREAFENGEWSTLGSLLGNKLNEMVDTINWSGIGDKLGYGLNGAIATTSSFLDTVDWYNISAKISTMFNNTISQIDFSNLGRICISKFTILGDLIIGAIETIDWKQIGVSIKDFFVGAFDKGSEWIDGYDWNKLGSDLWTKFKDLINGLDFSSIARSFFTLFGKALAAAVQLVGSFFSGIVQDILSYFDQYITNEDGTKKTGLDLITGILEGIIDGLKDIGTWIKENVFDPIIDGFKSLFKINSPSKVMKEIGGYIVDGFKEGLDGFNKLKSKVKEWSGNIVEWFTKGEDGKGIVENFQELGENIISKFKETVSTKYTNTKSAITTWASKIKSWFTKDGDINETEWQGYADNTINGFKTKISNGYTNTKNAITTWASKVKSWFTDDGKVNNSQWSTYGNNILTGFKNKISNDYVQAKSSVSTWATNVNNWFTQTANSNSFGENAKNLIIGFGNGINNLYYRTCSGVQTWANSVNTWFRNNANNSTFYSSASDIINGFKNGISSLYYNTKSNISTWASNVVSWFKNNANSNSFYSAASDVINGFKNGIGGLYYNTKSNISTWGSNAVTWFKNNCNSSSFYNVASDVVNGFKNGIGALYSNTKSAIESWASSVESWFKKKLGINSPSKVFAEYGNNVVQGFNNSVDKNSSSTKITVSSWASNTTSTIKNTVSNVTNKVVSGIKTAVSTVSNVVSKVASSVGSTVSNVWNNTKKTVSNVVSGVSSWFKNKLGINSPSKLFYSFGENVIQGFNNAIYDLGHTSENAMSSWTKEIISSAPSVSLGMDTSSLDYNASSLASNLGISADGSIIVDENDSETNALLEQLIAQVANIDLNPYISVNDIGKASVKYIKQQSRIMGTNLV